MSMVKEAASQNEEEEEQPKINVRVSDDKLTAYLNVELSKPSQTVTYDQVMACLKEQGIVYGICNDSIRDFCENKKYFLEIPCAHGIDPIDETDGQLEYLFDRNQSRLPAEREDGTVDFRDLGLVQNVSKDDVLCRILPPAPGKDGTDVFNQPVAYKKGKLPKFPSGKNTVVSEDGLTLSAAIDGCIEYKKTILNINEVFIVRGNVDSSSGNIDFLGSVVIKGDVLEGFSVKAGGDISVRGTVEGATLDAGGNIVISEGMNGMGRGKVQAKGNITARYFENATIQCDGDVCADVVMNCNITSGHSVRLRGRHALLVGGTCRAARQIYAKTIGSSSNVRTEVGICSEILTHLLAKDSEETGISEKLEKEREKEETLRKQIDLLSKVISTTGRHLGKAKLMLRQLLENEKNSAAQIQELEKKAALEEKMKSESPADYNIIGLKVIYAGTRLLIGNFTMDLTNDYSNTKFYAGKDQIVQGPVLPSDQDS